MLCYVMLCYVMLCYVMLCYVMLCYVTESCPSGRADNKERHCIKDHTSKVTQHLLVSCSRVTFNNAVKYCHSIGGQILRNHTHLETTFKKFPPQSFYNCKKFWLCCNGKVFVNLFLLRRFIPYLSHNYLSIILEIGYGFVTCCSTEVTIGGNIELFARKNIHFR